MTCLLDPEQAHLAALDRIVDFRGLRIPELGCGDGHVTAPIARKATSVLAFDPDEEAVERARRPGASSTTACTEAVALANGLPDPKGSL